MEQDPSRVTSTVARQDTFLHPTMASILRMGYHGSAELLVNADQSTFQPVSRWTSEDISTQAGPSRRHHANRSARAVPYPARETRVEEGHTRLRVSQGQASGSGSQAPQDTIEDEEYLRQEQALQYESVNDTVRYNVERPPLTASTQREVMSIKFLVD